MEWSSREEEFVKRAGFALMAALAVHDKKAEDERFLPFLSAIEMESYDDRNYVRKAVNWALRNIGKRNTALNASAIACAERIRAEGTKSGRWIASDALRELRSDTVKRRLAKHK
ncbi:MAG: DNA alkylation repair enzyme [Methanomassiliicoccales archaeon PtaU1.Bin030]|nr:MAG: DNA alkylation repair enzyme [Methanomassiliicoccales archaeon PtaU1.Bin030]